MSDITDYPRVYLAIDNCFAAKRWTRPSEWAKIIKDLGLTYIEAGADNECDPLYNGREYLDDWVDHVKNAQAQFVVKVANLYSGHGTYTSLGLTHNDPRVRDRFQNRWLKEMVNTAERLNAGLGFFCHAFTQAVLNDSMSYSRALEDLYNRLSQVSTFSAKKVKTLSLEQMYSPHQVPWTIEGAVGLLEQIYARSGHPFYITIDVGHQTHQKKYKQPNFEQIKEYLQLFRANGFVKNMWLGPNSAYRIFNKALALSGQRETDAIAKIIAQMQAHPYLFASSCDGDPYCWLRKLSCWSPIIHLQQTDGRFSSHNPFTDEYNSTGIINGKKVLQEIATAFEQDFPDTLPPVCKDIYLTLEVFFPTADMPVDIITKLEDTVEYWRRFIPADGLNLGVIMAGFVKDKKIKPRPVIPVRQTTEKQTTFLRSINRKNQADV